MEDYLTRGRGFVQWDAALHQLCKSPVRIVHCFLGFAVLVEEGWLLPMLLLQPLSKKQCPSQSSITHSFIPQLTPSAVSTQTQMQISTAALVSAELKNKTKQNKPVRGKRKLGFV